MLVGHSLGCHIISSFAWDVHKWKQQTDTEIDQEPNEGVRQLAHIVRLGGAVRRLDTFAGFITLGSNMPLFTFTFGPDGVFPITRTRAPSWTPAFPGPALSPSMRIHARWINIYSPNDILGYPLKALNPTYENEPLLSDIPVCVEGFNPFNYYDTHVKYWTHKRVIAEVRNLVQPIIEAK